jgi:uncharacterized protein (DUF488 family)
MIKLFTIGFTQKTAEHFFSLLVKAGVRNVIDTRLNNRSQLAGFSKADDLPFFLRAIGEMSYRHATEMAPTQDMLDRYKKLKGSWSEYEEEFRGLLERRRLIESISIADLNNSCLLCSEHEPQNCHRRLVAEYVQSFHPQVLVTHLL